MANWTFLRRASPVVLGHLEQTVMEILWRYNDVSVHEVLARLDRPLAYTTVMTTLDRLFKKGLLERRKRERAFFYAARLTRAEWDHKRTGDFMAEFLGQGRPSRERLVSCFVETVGEHDQALLDELEKKIRLKRRELAKREKA